MPALAFAHAFEERYDLPAPLSYFATGAAAVVVLSFVIAQVVVEHTSPAPPRTRILNPGAILPALRIAGRTAALLLFALTIFAGLYGTADPLMNFAPTMVWIIWWVGLSLVVACVGNIWPALDPWRTLYDAIDWVAQRMGASRGLTLGWRYPAAIGAWPAVALLLALSWFEVAYPQAAVPYRLASVALTWSAVTLIGMVCFGGDTWQRNADVFAIYFATLGRFAPFAAAADKRSLVLRAPGRGLITGPDTSTAMVCFVMAMLSTVLFDGLLSGQVWWLAQTHLKRIAPFLVDPDGYRMGAAGLTGVWLLFLAAYLLTCAVTAALVRGRSTGQIARLFAFTLVPIAIAYNVAHNFANLIVQGQQLIALASDPLGAKWNLFGTANFRPDIGLIDARLTWYIAIAAIVGGHVIAVWLAHRLALHEFGTRRQAALATVPLTLLMVAYTVISLSVIAEPMVKFDIPEPVNPAATSAVPEYQPSFQTYLLSGEPS
ncbi:MAG TPA: hypothetical protein VGO84_17980 [Burkholderiales bacterium]|nr:hypothetical protein [Burkholderiales bacterium]